MTFHEFERGMTVMDGRRCIAAARKTVAGPWMLTLHGGCWIDSRHDPLKLSLVKRGMIRSEAGKQITDHLKVVRTKPQARKWMKGLLSSISEA